MIRYRYTELEGAFGCEYEFERAGEYLKEHRHVPHLRHACRCLRGRALVEINPSGEREPRQVVLDENSEVAEPDFDSSLPHRVTALEAGTVVFHRMYVSPPDVEDLLALGQSTVDSFGK